MATYAVEHAVRREVARDGTVKFTFAVPRGLRYEACLLDLAYRKIPIVICVSTQIGCPLDCAFCAVGKTQFLRNLEPTEILEQIKLVATDPAWPGGDFELAAMGTGEPLYALNELLEATSEAKNRFPGLCSLNLSTVGIPTKIREYTRMEIPGVRLNLQISLHATSDHQRHSVMPRASSLANLDSVVEACREFSMRHGRKVTVNYLLLRGFNDSENDLIRLTRLLDPQHFAVKVSTLNATSDNELLGGDPIALQRFSSSLRGLGFEARVFSSAGVDIRAGCGQFSNVPVS